MREWLWTFFWAVLVASPFFFLFLHFFNELAADH
jgi:hypothetical protein